mmetsp:Transcript_6076/g.24374  ORF Transcript_6076/g.24374 Transcript_6076/m.24374 type:complete len:322 (+) Transcript_6076:6468-7433(+)
MDRESWRSALGHPADRLLHDFIDVHPRALLVMARRKAPQPLHDLGRARRTFERALDQRRQVAAQGVDSQLLAQRGQVVGTRAGVQRIQVPFQTLFVADQRVHVAEHEADRVVQLMRHAGHEPPQRGEFFGMQQLLLGALERFVRGAQLAVRALEFTGRAAHQHMPHAAARRVHARGAVELDGHALAGHVRQLEFDRHRVASRQRGFGGAPQSTVVVCVGQQAEHRCAAQQLLVAADQRAQRCVDVLDPAFCVAGHQQVAHRRQQADDEALRLLELRVLLFQRHFFGDKLRIDLVHLLDDVDPRRFVHAFDPGCAQRGAVRC